MLAAPMSRPIGPCLTRFLNTLISAAFPWWRAATIRTDNVSVPDLLEVQLGPDLVEQSLGEADRDFGLGGDR